MIATFHCHHLDMLFQIMSHLIGANSWFDVRTVVIDEKWSITYNTDISLPMKLARFLDVPKQDHHPTRHEPLAARGKDVVAAVKAQRRKERKGTRR